MVIRLIKLGEILFGLVRNKIISLFLGVEGIYFVGLFTSALNYSTRTQEAGVKTLYLQRVSSAQLSSVKRIMAYDRLYLGASLLLSLSSFGVLLLVLGNNADYSSQEYFAMFFMVASAVINNFAINKLRAERRRSRLILLLILNQIVGVIGLLPILFNQENTPRTTILSMLFLMALGGVVVSFSVMRISSFVSVFTMRYQQVRRILRDIKSSYLYLLTPLISSLSVLSSFAIVRYFFGTEAGIFTAAFNLSRSVSGVITSSLGLITFPEILANIKDAQNNFSKYISGVIRQYTFLFSITGVVLIFLGDVLIELLYSKAFLGSKVIIVMAISSIPLKITNLIFGYYFVGFDLKLKQLRHNIVIELSFILSLVIYGAMGRLDLLGFALIFSRIAGFIYGHWILRSLSLKVNISDILLLLLTPVLLAVYL